MIDVVLLFVVIKYGIYRLTELQIQCSIIVVIYNSNLGFTVSQKYSLATIASIVLIDTTKNFQLSGFINDKNKINARLYYHAKD